MLDSPTKKRIDDARQILVGKVPDPKSQVEQITIALIYKFMDDMDRESEAMGGKASFFVKGYAKYSWRRIFAPKLSGAEQLKTYSEALEKLSLNEALPELFREIFKNAYLPYRDPETLRLFLKTIGEFEYDHSERLGDAFEYLLSVLGSQGDAGQFRTPRHIIDFMVEVVDPKKNETILDPACGTAGFLISAWKHIRAANTKKRPGDALKPADKTRLMDNVVGYDISPDMVRLSLVNLYLHGFARPKIYEYDSLTSTAYWDEHFDVIMANPPFMSPKGGIRPHRKFSVASSRSEVLFVDYIAEHLLPSGRAAVIVPEGIIFQSQSAYVYLRKMLVEDCLVAVVSLPAGVFNPYSGVKTSILFLDKALAKRANTIAFFKVENDGFGLGAQRREIDKDDLPKVKAELGEYLGLLRAGEAVEDLVLTTGLVVSKEKVAGKGEYNLSGERYREGNVRSSHYPLVPIGDVCDLINGRPFKPEDWKLADSGGIPIVRIQNLNSPESEFNYYTGEVRDCHIINEGELLFSWSGSRGTSFGAHIWKGDKAVLNQHIFKVGFDESLAIKMYLLHALNKAVTEVEENLHGGVGLVHITKGDLERIKIPLPPLDVQKVIVAEIEDYQRVIDGARAVVDYYRPHIHIRPEWPMVELGEVCTAVLTGPFGSSLHQRDYVPDGIPIINPQNIIDGKISRNNVNTVSSKNRDRLQEFTVHENDIVIGRRGEMGRCAVVTSEMDGWLCGTGCFVIRLSPECNVHFAFLQIASPRIKAFLEEQAVGVTMKNLNQDILSTIRIPLPPLATQHAIVTEIEAEQKLVAANRELIERFEKKIQATLARVWGEETKSNAMKQDLNKEANTKL
jgi:type I restriction enzyme M protein